jgi:hypothetical protein
MQTEIDVMRDVSARLEQACIAYMLTGSLAMNFYAQPRMTRAIDLVIEMDTTRSTNFLHAFTSDYYVSKEAVLNSIVHQSLFNLIHNESVIKVDCILRKSTEYRIFEFKRRRQVTIEDFTTWIVSKEDLIISKLDWAKDSLSELQLRDVKNLIQSGCD